MSFEWTQELQIDNGQIDADHKELIAIANRILEMNKPSQDAEELKSIVRELYDYVKHHFTQEEEIMERLGYPKLEEHHEKHEIIIRDMNHFISSAQNISSIFVNFRRLVNKWVINHIMEEDKKIHVFMVTKLAAAPQAE